MNWLDIVILIALLLFTISAYSAGLIREVVSLLAIFLGVIIAGALYKDLAADVLVFINNDDAARAVAFLALFGSVYLLGQLTAYVLKRAASLLLLGWADHLGGAAFGFLKGIMVIQVLLILFAAYPQLSLDDAINNSRLAPLFIDDAPFLLHLLPGEFDTRIDRFLSPEGF